jgi:hypothetical protein
VCQLFEGLPTNIDILKLIEETAANDPELDKHIDIFDVCSKERGVKILIYCWVHLICYIASL